MVPRLWPYRGRHLLYCFNSDFDAVYNWETVTSPLTKSFIKEKWSFIVLSKQIKSFPCLQYFTIYTENFHPSDSWQKGLEDWANFSSGMTRHVMFQQASQYFAQLGIGEHYKVNIRISVHTEANKHKICAKIAWVEQRPAYVFIRFCQAQFQLAVQCQLNWE